MLFPAPGSLPNAGVKPESLVPPALVGGLFTTEPLGQPSEQAWPLFSEFFLWPCGKWCTLRASSGDHCGEVFAFGLFS